LLTLSIFWVSMIDNVKIYLFMLIYFLAFIVFLAAVWRNKDVHIFNIN